MESEEFESYVIEESTSDRRTFTRFRPDDQMRQTLLVYRRKEYPAKLMNLSAGGCEVATSHKVKAKVGDELILLSKLGRFMTRVAHVERESDQLRLGLRLVGEFVAEHGNQMRLLEVRRAEPLAETQQATNHWLPVIAVAIVAGLACVVSNHSLRGELLHRLQVSIGAAQNVAGG